MNTQQIFDFITSRRSMGRLLSPAPTQSQVREAVKIALTAPDHKMLRPYRFVVLENQALDELGLALYQALLDKGETDQTALDKAKMLPKRAPMIITCVTDYKNHPKVPKFEQLLSAGAGVQNLLLALEAQGFGSVWRSGDLMNEVAVKQFFNLNEQNDVVGFIYVGTKGAELPERKPINVDDFVSFQG